MPRTDKSVAILTGMIVAALYVILLVGFIQESSMWRRSYPRDAASRPDNGSRPMADESARPFCAADLPLCAALFPDASERQSCLLSMAALRRFVSEPLLPQAKHGWPGPARR
jgi:hypothetical protein